MNKITIKAILKKIIPSMLRDKLLAIYSQYITNKFVMKASWVFKRNSNVDGVNLIGFIRGEIGLGQSCRLVATALNETNYGFSIYNYDVIETIKHNDYSWDSKILNSFPHNINVFHLNPPELIQAYKVLDLSVWENRYNIGYWLWELEDFPDEWLPALNLVDEVWTPAEFISKNLRKYTSKPVHTLTYPMVANTSNDFDRNYFGLPLDQFLFITMYDINSTMERKNPMATIKAFKSAFDSNRTDVGLVIKVNNANEKEIAMIKDMIYGYTNVYIIAKTFSKVEVNSLIKVCNSLVSLHRAEGYGLPLAEAMILGRPVIGTNWSANTEFMNAQNSCLVDFKLINLDQNYSMYKKGSRWADANIEHAAQYMNRLVSDADFYNNLADNARFDMAINNSIYAASKAIQERINEILSKSN